MMHRRRIGAWDICNIVEYAGPTHDPARVFPDLAQSDLDSLAERLGPDQYVPDLNRFVVAIQIWIARKDDTVVVIDTGIGNGRDRTPPRQKNLNTRVADWLAAAGATADRVTHVVNTHLHSDHVGWNVTIDEHGTALTFPNASHYLPKKDIEYFGGQFEAGNARAGDGSYAECVLPVLREASHEIVEEPFELVSDIRVVPAHGHTPGMYNLYLESEGERGVFCADIFHSPVQILRPELNTAFCIVADEARATRRRFLNEMADSGTIVMPCHFGFPHAVRVVREGSGYGFEPALPILP